MFRFTIRELVLLTLVVALGVGWWVDRQGLIGARMAVESHLVETSVRIETLREENELLGRMVGHMPESMRRPVDDP